MILLSAAVGWFFLEDGPSRLTALAARPSLLSFLSEAGPESVGTDILKQASGIQTLSFFMEEQEEASMQAETDPAYLALLAEAGGTGGNGSLLANAGPQGDQEKGTEGGAGATEENSQATVEAPENTDVPVAEGSSQETPENGTPEQGAPEGGGETGTEGAVAASGQPAMAATEVRGTLYTAEQLADFEFVKKKFFYVHKSTTVYPEQLDASVLLGKDLTLPESDEPQVLLFHTHGSEAFSDSAEGDANMTVVGVGNYLAELLSTQYGIQVIHNTEVFPYSDSYSMALDMLKRTLAEHPSIQVTIDLHRDSGGHEVVDINGKPTAPIMFFNGMCQTPDGPLEDVENPYLLDNLAFNFQLKMKAEAYYPGLTLRTFLKAYRYNQHVLPRATLVEVGTENNTFEEARNAMEPLADMLYKVLRGK